MPSVDTVSLQCCLCCEMKAGHNLIQQYCWSSQKGDFPAALLSPLPPSVGEELISISLVGKVLLIPSREYE